MSKFKAYVTANNDAVELLRKEEDRVAVDLLRLTLSDVKDVFSPAEASQAKTSLVDSTAHPEASPDIDNALNHSISSMSTVSEGDLVMKVTHSASHDQTKLGRVVRLPAPSLCPSMSSQAEIYLQMYNGIFVLEEGEEDGHIVASIILWNMAVANHRRGLRLGKGSSLERALELYKTSLYLLFKSLKGHCYALLRLGIYNNTAQVYSQLFRVAELVECVHYLRQAVAELDFDEESDDHSFFFLNVMFYSERELVLAPAA